MKSGSLNFLEPSGPLQACNGTALHFTFYRYFYKPVAQNVQKTVMNWKECARKQLWLNLSYHLRFCLRRLMKMLKTLSHGSRSQHHNPDVSVIGVLYSLFPSFDISYQPVRGCVCPFDKHVVSTYSGRC